MEYLVDCVSDVRSARAVLEVYSAREDTLAMVQELLSFTAAKYGHAEVWEFTMRASKPLPNSAPVELTDSPGETEIPCSLPSIEGSNVSFKAYLGSGF